MQVHRQCDACRICGNPDLVPILDLGHQYLGSIFPGPGREDPPSAPLILLKCNTSTSPDSCGLVQLQHTVSASELYTDNYGYRSGLNDTMTSHLARLVEEIESHWRLAPGDMVVDIGCNDATLLSRYSVNLKKVGIDPSGPQFREYYPSDVLLIPEFFNRDVFFAELGSTARAKVVTSISMFYDLPDPMAFVQDVRAILADEGVWVMEQSYLPTMISMNSYDTVCHEHLEYYCLDQIQWMCQRSELRIIDVSLNNINGGSFRVTLCKRDAPLASRPCVAERLADEVRMGWNTLQPYIDFAERCRLQRETLVTFLRQQKADGKSVAIYGASTKGNTILQYSSIDSSLITSGVAERNPRKYGCRTPGTGIPIDSEQVVRARNPDFMLVLPWHFKEEFVKREQTFLQEGGTLVFPLPSLELVKSSKSSNSKKTAVVLGASGQIGAYLVEVLLEKNYTIYCLTGTGRSPRRSVTSRVVNIPVDIMDHERLSIVLKGLHPDEVYNLAAVTDSNLSRQDAMTTLMVNGVLVASLVSILTGIFKENESSSSSSQGKRVKFFQANSTELFKGCPSESVDESTVTFHPMTPYGIGKLAAYWLVKNQRSEGMFACSGICCNIESPLRRETFVTMKVVRHLQRKRKDSDETPLLLGDVNVQRDWMHARDAARAMHMILQQDEPGDYMISTQVIHTLKEFSVCAARALGVPGQWEGGDFVGPDGTTWMVSDPAKARSYESTNSGTTLFDNSKLRSIGWEAERTFEELVVDLCLAS